MAHVPSQWHIEGKECTALTSLYRGQVTAKKENICRVISISVSLPICHRHKFADSLGPCRPAFISLPGSPDTPMSLKDAQLRTRRKLLWLVGEMYLDSSHHRHLAQQRLQ